jgi:hypothetical protein
MFLPGKHYQLLKETLLHEFNVAFDPMNVDSNAVTCVHVT